MKRRSVTTAAAWAAVLLVPVAAWAVELRYTFRVGEELQYTETMTASGDLAMDSVVGQQTIPLEVEATEQRTMKTTQAVGEGVFWVESLSKSASGTVTMAGQKMQQDVAGADLKMRLNTRGDVLEVKRLGNAAPKDGELDLKLDSLLSAARLASFPAGDVEVGATWDKEIPLRSAGGTRLTAKASSKLLRLTTVDGRAMAEIETRYDIPIPQTEGTFSMGGTSLPVQVSGRSTGKSTALWDIAAGRTQSNEGTGKLELKLTLAGSPANAKFDVTYGIELAQ